MRLPDWTQHLELFIEQRQEMPFRWGRSDCCLFAADAVKAMTGIDCASEFRGKYRTEHGAARFLLRAGGLYELVKWVAASAGLCEIAPRMARRGDLALVQGDREALGIMTLSGDAVWCVTPAGLIELPLNSIMRAWRT